MKPVAVIGGGITGLVAAFELQRKGVPVRVYEAGGRVGGVLQSLRQDGYLAEFGPNTILETSPRIGELIRDAGLAARRLDPDPRAAARYVVRHRRPIAMPGSLPGFLCTRLFSWPAKLAVLREPFVPPRRDGVEESIGQFVTRRFNQEFLDHAIDALVAGIYAGDPHKLSVTHAFPKLKALEDKYGSMIKGQIFGARERKRRGEIAKDRAPKFSFDEGLQVLPDTLAARLGNAIQLNTAVTGLRQTERGWTLDWQQAGRAGQTEHSAAVYCGTAHQLAELRLELCAAAPPSAVAAEIPGRPPADASPNRLDLSPFSAIRHPPVASVVLGFRREDVRHPCAGFGMLIPRIAGFKILGTIFSSSLFPNRAPAGHLTLTSYVGGERYPELTALPPELLVEVVREDLRLLLGARGEPTFRHCVVYPRAIPQYNVGYGRFKERMTDLEIAARGMFLAGHYRDGISVSDSIVSAFKVAERVENTLKSGQNSHA